MLPKKFWIVVLACIAGIAILTWVILGHWHATEAPDVEARRFWLDLMQRGKERASWLQIKGYVGIPLLAANSGLLEVVAQVNGENMLFFLDTGSTDSMVHEPLAEHRRLPSRMTERSIVGVGGKTKELRRFDTDDFVLGGRKRKFDAFLKDLTDVNKPQIDSKDLSCDGLLGASFFVPHAAIIDYGSGKLFLLDSAPDSAAKDKQQFDQVAVHLAAMLKAQNYIEVPLLVDKGGLPSVIAEINGQSVRFVVDTAAMSSYMDTTVARGLHLPQQETKTILRGSGGSTENAKKTKVEEFTLESLRRPLDLFLYDFSEIKAATLQEGGTPYEGLVGADYLSPLAAVIDYGAAKLYLLEPKRF